MAASPLAPWPPPSLRASTEALDDLGERGTLEPGRTVVNAEVRALLATGG